MSTIVFDLDGVLANCDHRVNFAQMKEWDAFHAAAVDDKPYTKMVELMAALDPELDIVVLTGRNEKYRQQTLQWLNFNCFLVSTLLMRPDEDWRPDVEVKLELLQKHYLGNLDAARADVICIIEDRHKVVEMWRKQGFMCLQPREGAF